jgi:hypothetical protein
MKKSINMKKFNIDNERIIVEKKSIMEAINSGKTFGITHLGKVVYPPYNTSDIFIFKGSMDIDAPSFAIAKEKGVSTIFGELYKIEETPETVIINASLAWGDIVGFNLENASYDDTTNDGIMDLGDNELEDMSWHATEFNINNRDISEVIENKCDGTLFCLHKEEPFMFSALIFIEDMDCARKKVKEYITTVIEHKIENDPNFKRESLTKDEEEAALFFNII